MQKIRNFELISNYSGNLENFKFPKRATKYSAGYDIFNNTGKDIIIKSGEISEAITTSLKAYMLPDEYLAIHVRSGHGFKYSVRLANTVGVIDCVPAGTQIKTTIGDMNVEKLMDGKIPIYSYNEEQDKVEEDLLKDIWIVDNLELLEITTEDDIKIQVPKNKLLLTKRGWIEAQCLSKEDFILSFE